jgi:hypothetical protein
MICGVHGSPGNSVTEPTWSNRKPVGTALACAAGFFTCAQPAIPVRTTPAINKCIGNVFTLNKSEFSRE